MDTTTKKCPMCAEQIPLDAAVCEYCGTKLEEGETIGKVREEPIAPPKSSEQVIPPSMSAPKKSSPWVWVAAGLGLLLVIAVVGGGILIAQNSLPFLATPTNTPRPTSTPRPTRTPNYEATRQAQNTQAAATAQFAWVQEFAQPILDDVHNRQPDFEDNFSEMSGRFVRWKDLPPGVTFPEGAMRINTTGAMEVDAGGSMNAKNFVLEFEFTPRLISEGSTAVVNFRWNDAGGYNFDFNLFDTWWGLLSIPEGQDVKVIAEGWSEEADLNRSTFVTVIAKNDRFAFFANGRPLIYAGDGTFGGDWAGLGVWSPNSPAEVDFDNVKFWDLKP